MKSRSEVLQQIEGGTFDVCIIGGGATGAGCAVDSQLRGLKTVVIEAGDYSAATSSSSTKLVHGGVRYLQEAVEDLDAGQYHVVKRALHERRLMLDNAPYLAHPLELLVPCYSRMEALYYGIGMKMYDWIAGKGNLFPSRYRSVAESVKRMPMLKPDGLTGTVAYGDGQFDDARYGMALIQTFSDEGGLAVNYARVVGLEKDAGGRLKSADVEDLLTHRKFKVRARAFINATGPFSDFIREMANPGVANRLRLSKGVHILLPLDKESTKDAILIPKTDDGRVIFAIPWLGRFLVGTTDDEAQHGDEMIVTKTEAEYLLRHLNRYLVSPMRLDEIVSGFAGVRPLVKSKNALDTKKLIRDHEVEMEEESGLISVLGWQMDHSSRDGSGRCRHGSGLPRKAAHPLSYCPAQAPRCGWMGAWVLANSGVGVWSVPGNGAPLIAEVWHCLPQGDGDRQTGSALFLRNRSRPGAYPGGNRLHRAAGDGVDHRGRTGPTHRLAVVQLGGCDSGRAGSGIGDG